MGCGGEATIYPIKFFLLLLDHRSEVTLTKSTFENNLISPFTDLCMLFQEFYQYFDSSN